MFVPISRQTARHILTYSSDQADKASHSVGGPSSPAIAEPSNSKGVDENTSTSSNKEIKFQLKTTMPSALKRYDRKFEVYVFILCFALVISICESPVLPKTRNGVWRVYLRVTATSTNV